MILFFSLICSLNSPPGYAQPSVTNLTRDGSMDEAQADFALDLIRTATTNDESVVLSPFSVVQALTMTYVGAEGETKKQMSNVLTKGQGRQQFNKYFSSLLTDITKKKGKYILNLANRIYIQQNFDLKLAYLNIIKSHYDGQLQQVNFTQEDAIDDIITEINKWVMQQTNDKIKNLISQSDISTDTKLLLVNAVYFKGNWKKSFNKKMTKKKTFHGDKLKEMEMMTMEGYFPYYEDDDVQVLGMPYAGDEVHLYIVLPQKQSGLVDIEKNLTGKKLLHYMQSCSEIEVKVEIPKFKIENRTELVNSLQEMGINDAFTSAANFTGITDVPLYINAVFHESFIEVNEKGTEAAAASAVGIFLRSAPITLAPVKLFRANHPHLFAITWHSSTILFIGRIV
uniref:SERPIN domain-containing protein n=1 Tax=Onchocerca volvulus TaxID=6282 RepID=A0A8R1U0N6_ONCVO